MVRFWPKIACGTLNLLKFQPASALEQERGGPVVADNCLWHPRLTDCLVNVGYPNAPRCSRPRTDCRVLIERCGIFDRSVPTAFGLRAPKRNFSRSKGVFQRIASGQVRARDLLALSCRDIDSVQI